ncbi:glycosyltransferase family A protein [Desulfonatronum sp. SC1]|uniref:glycosyltransferase family 2 protein n=1 Tax=Desulfonatronum sp. SC1 TaxID=2109626 RepID=UPI000D325871|nr:glycosyltransferase family A protein [Desulfonatronum sp. SC1]PTN34124.1 glycosyl transferase [Desulfonatronum sp. SC1]
MLVSIVIPVFNRPEQVLRAIRSVLAQRDRNGSWRAMEVLVVDDGSTDATPSVLREIRDPRMRVLRHERNQGVSAARNTGLAAAQGEYLALLDSDDWWLAEKLAIHLACHEAGGWRISQTDEIWIRHGRRVNPMVKHAKPEGWFFEDALKLCLISPSCVLFDRRFWEEVGPFDPTLPACEDYDLWLRTLVRHPVGFCPEKLVHKTGGHPDQLSKKIIGLDLYRIQALAKLLRTEVLSSSQRSAALRELRAKARVYISGCLKHDKPEEAERIKRWLGPWLESPVC